MWGVVKQTADWLLDEERRHLICTYFDHAVLDREVLEEGEDGDDLPDRVDVDEDFRREAAVNLRRCATVIPCGMFWSLRGLVQHICNWTGQFQNKLKGCKCHPSALREHFADAFKDLDCPLKCCWAPDLANGFAIPYLDRICGAFFQSYMDGHCSGLTPNERAIMIDQFTIAKEFIIAELRIRLDGWGKLPLRAFALAIGDLDQEIQCMVDCLLQFQALTDEELRGMSHLTWYLFSRAGPCRAQVVLLVQRARTYADLPELREVRCKMAFAPVLEFSVEMKHALISLGIRSSPNHSIAFASAQALRRSTVEEVLSTSEGSQKLYESLKCMCRSPSSCVGTLQLAAHPHLRDYISEDTGKLQTCVPHHLAVDVIYRNDPWSQCIGLDNANDDDEGPPPFLDVSVDIGGGDGEDMFNPPDDGVDDDMGWMPIDPAALQSAPRAEECGGGAVAGAHSNQHIVLRSTVVACILHQPKTNQHIVLRSGSG